MPDLVNKDGETLAPSLTKEELEVLAEEGVEFDLSEDESDDTSGADDGEATRDPDSDESIEDVETDDDVDEPEPSESGEATDEGDSTSDAADGSDGDSAGDEAGGESEGLGDLFGDPDDGGESDESDAGESDGADGGEEPGEGDADEMGEGDTPGGGSEDAETGGDGEEVPGEAELSDEAGDHDGPSPDEVVSDSDEHEHEISPDDELVEEMDDRDEDEELEDKFDVDLDEVHRVDDRDIERWHQLVKSLNEYDTDLEARKRERDERMDSVRTRQDSTKIEERAHSSGAISDLKDGFRKLVSRPTPRPATAGPQIDPHNVVRRAAGDRTVRELFEEQVEVETGERCVGLATDISGSMRSDITELKIAGGVIAEATEIIGDDFVWEAFTDQYNRSHTPSEERLDLRIVTGPNESFEWGHVDSFTDSYNEPTAAGVRDCRTLMEQTSARQYVMIVITDGVTLIEEDGTYQGSRSPAPVDQARRAVEECRQDGFDVIGLGIGDMDEEKMEEQFGTDAQGNPNYKLTDIDSLAEDILEIYRAQMNVTRR